MVNVKSETNKLSQYSFLPEITNSFTENTKYLSAKFFNALRNASLFFNVNTFMAHWKSMYAKYMTRNMWGNKNKFLYLFSR